MKPAKRRRRVAPAPVAPTMQIDLDGDWRPFTRLLPKDCEVIGTVTIGGDDSGALVRLAKTRTLVKVTGGEVTMLNQHRVAMKLDAIARQAHSPALEMVSAEEYKA
jgi:hypothetical protein